MTIFDASALLAFIQREPGHGDVEEALIAGGSCSAANWSEVGQKVLARGRPWTAARQLLLSYPLEVEPVTPEDGEWAAQRWREGEALSLADRLCLALRERLGGEALTADKHWRGLPGVRVIR